MTLKKVLLEAIKPRLPLEIKGPFDDNFLCQITAWPFNQMECIILLYYFYIGLKQIFCMLYILYLKFNTQRIYIYHRKKLLKPIDGNIMGMMTFPFSVLINMIVKQFPFWEICMFPSCVYVSHYGAKVNSMMEFPFSHHGYI